MLGLDRHNHSRVIAAVGAILFSGHYDDQDIAKVYRLSMAVNQRIKAYAASIGALDEFVYLPYADATQHPLGSYGKNNSDHSEEWQRTMILLVSFNAEFLVASRSAESGSIDRRSGFMYSLAFT